MPCGGLSCRLRCKLELPREGPPHFTPLSELISNSCRPVLPFIEAARRRESSSKKVTCRRPKHLFRSCIGSPDPYGRQLDGMGGGVSSVSKVCIVKQSEHPEADVDFTFVQVSSHHDNTRSWGLILRSYSTSGRRQRWDPGYRLKLWKHGVRNRTFCTREGNAKHDR
jgi:hypothetical protein